MKNPIQYCANAVARTLAVAALTVAACSPVAAQTLTQGFDDITMLRGWQSVNQSDPPGQAWFQGNSGIFGAQAGAADSYIAANFLSAGDGLGPIDNWLLMPQLATAGTMTLTFYTRSAGTPGFADTLSVLYGSGDETSAFTHTVLTVGAVAAYPDSWQEFIVTVNANSGDRFAFRYTGSGALNDYIGIDSVSISMGVSPVPEPSPCLLFGAGLALLGYLRQRARRLAAVGLNAGLSAGLTAGLSLGLLAAGVSSGAAAQDGMVVVRDAATGQLRAPTAAEFQALQAAARKGAPAQALTLPRATTRSDGTRQARLGQSAMVYSVVTRDSEGHLRQTCVNGPTEADAVLGATSTTEAGHENN